MNIYQNSEEIQSIVEYVMILLVHNSYLKQLTQALSDCLMFEPAYCLAQPIQVSY